MSTPPALVAHADWSVTPNKRWLAVATPAETGWRVRVQLVGEIGSLLGRLQDEAAGGKVLLGVDAPIGLPQAYAHRHAGATSDFPTFLAALSADDPFFTVCERIEEVSGARPFFPRTTRFAPRRQAQADRLGVACHEALLRRCDRQTVDRPRAACLFWTLGPNQVGKAALSFWRDLLLPAMQGAEPPALWPFAGPLPLLLERHRVTIAETYPAEALRRLGGPWRGSKRRQSDRAAIAAALSAWLLRHDATAEPELAADLADGFGPLADGEDRFDSLLGLLGMLDIVRSPEGGGAPEDPAVAWEGWIFGQRP